MTNKFPFSYYTTSELIRAATTPKISTKTRLQMQDEIKRREEAGE